MRTKLFVTLAALAGLSLFALPSATSAPESPPASAVQEEDSGDADLSAWQRFNNKADATFASLNGFLGGYIFYPIGSSEETVVGPFDPADYRASFDALFAKFDAEADMDPVEANLELVIPEGAMTLDERLRFTEEVNLERTGSRKISISEYAPEEDEPAVLVGATLTGKEPGIQFAVLWLVLGAIFFTIRMRFINIRGFKHALAIVRGKYDNPDDEGEVSHFQALASALSATVGLGNIAGVAIAISIGGPGATFWMICAGFLGMTSKFVECTLALIYREVRPNGRMMGGPMVYLGQGLRDLNPGLAPLGKFLAVFFAILCVGGSLAGGNAFQVSQSMDLMKENYTFLAGREWLYGLTMTVLVGVVIIGGIKRIAATAEKIVPFMCLLYVAACLFILVSKAPAIPGAFGEIISGAFTPAAGYGGAIGVLVQGFKRAAFSNEAGTGSAAIAHSAAKTDWPIREGAVAMLGPFIDTVVICTMTALVIVITGAYNNPEYATFVATDQGAVLTSKAMSEVISWFPNVLAIAVMFFAFSTIISWSYYGERCWCWMFGDKASMGYKILFLAFVFLGSVVSATNVLAFGDLMILGMALPNILGVVLLSGKVKVKMDEYWQKLDAGEFKTYK